MSHWCYVFLFLSVLLPLHAQPVATPANIVCYQEIAASQGTYAQINASFANWSQRMYQTLGLTGNPELAYGWARVPDRTGFENGCNGPYPAIADLFVHIQTTSAQYDAVSARLEAFIAANRISAQPNIACSARSVVTFLPGCGKVGAGNIPPSNATDAPTTAPTDAPSGNATTAPTDAPSGNATTAPTDAPSAAPTDAPSGNATEAPTDAPSGNATAAPTELPTGTPSNDTTVAPTDTPSNDTTVAPTDTPSNDTTVAPTVAPTGTPSNDTTVAPTDTPTDTPSNNATVAPSDSPTSGPTGASPTSAPSTTTVLVNSNFYTPSNVTINVGDTVYWEWVSGFHTVTSGTPNNADGKFCSLSGNATPSVEACSSTNYATSPPYNYSHRFDEAGTYPYYCTIHGAIMVGSVTVNANTVASVSTSDESATGSVTWNQATTTINNTGIGMMISFIITIISMFQH